MGQITDVAGSVDVTGGHFDDVVTTKDWTPLEPDAVEQKCTPGVGSVHEELVAGGDELTELVKFTPWRLMPGQSGGSQLEMGRLNPMTRRTMYIVGGSAVAAIAIGSGVGF